MPSYLYRVSKQQVAESGHCPMPTMTILVKINVASTHCPLNSDDDGVSLLAGRKLVGCHVQTCVFVHEIVMSTQVLVLIALQSEAFSLRRFQTGRTWSFFFHGQSKLSYHYNDT